MSLHQGEEPGPDAAERPAAEPIPHAALDAVAAILRTLGEVAVAAPDAAEQLEAWARHVLVLDARPDPRIRPLTSAIGPA